MEEWVQVQEWGREVSKKREGKRKRDQIENSRYYGCDVPYRYRKMVGDKGFEH